MEAAKRRSSAQMPALVKMACADRNLAEQAFDLLSPESRGRLVAKLSQAGGEPPVAALSKLALRAGISLTPEGIRQFQKRQGLPVSGTPDYKTAEAMCREMSARWYKDLANTRLESCRWLDGPGEVNCVGLRGFDLRQGCHANKHNLWNDTIALIWSDRYGRMFVEEYPATTDPGVREVSSPDANGDKRGDPAWLIGDRQYEYRPGSHQRKWGALVPVRPSLPVNRDTNHNGRIDADENSESKVPGTGVNLHWGPDEPGASEGPVGNFSHGCQTFKMGLGEFRARVTPRFAGQNLVYYSLLDLRNKID